MRRIVCTEYGAPEALVETQAVGVSFVDSLDDAGRILTQISQRRAVGKYVLTTS